MIESKDYQYYVIKNGDFVGKFEEMYQNSSDIPWHQEEIANTIFTYIDLIQSFLKKIIWLRYSALRKIYVNGEWIHILAKKR